MTQSILRQPDCLTAVKQKEQVTIKMRLLILPFWSHRGLLEGWSTLTQGKEKS